MEIHEKNGFLKEVHIFHVFLVYLTMGLLEACKVGSHLMRNLFMNGMSAYT
jgi:hypothetical protein